MNKYVTYCLWLIFIISVIATIHFLTLKPTYNNFYFSFGIIFLYAVPVSFIVGVVFCISKQYRIFGFALLTVAAIALLIGMGLCSQYIFIHPPHR